MVLYYNELFSLERDQAE